MKRLLIVEDDASQRTLYELEFGKEGYQILTAVDGKEALEVLQTEPVDLVITDIRMPHMSGFDFLAGILSRYAGVPIIIYTAYDSFQDNYLAWGAEAYIIKHSDLTPLKEKVSELLTRQSVP